MSVVQKGLATYQEHMSPTLFFAMWFVLLCIVLWNIIRFFDLFLLAIVLSATVVGETKIPSTFRSSFMDYHGFVTRISRRGATSVAGTAYHSGPEFTPGFKWGLCYSIFSFMCNFL